VPENVRLVVGRRLDRLSEQTQQVLGIAAVIGRTFTYELLEAAAGGLDSEAVLDAVDDAERARLVVASPGRTGGEEFGFVHELVRHTLLTRLSAPRRRRLHVSVAEAMERTLGRVAEDQAADLAHHLVEAGPAADPAAASRCLVLAGRRAMDVSAFEDALRAFEQAMALAPVVTGEQAPAPLLEDLARAQRSVGLWDEAVRTNRAAIDAYEALGDLDSVGRLSAVTSWALCWSARFVEGHDVARRGLAAVAGRRTAEEGYLLATLGMTTGLTGSYAAGRAVIDEAETLARQLGDERLAAHVAEHRMHVEWCHIRHREAVEVGLRAARGHFAVGELWDQAMTLSFVVFALAQLGRFQEGGELQAELDPLAQRLGCFPALVLSHRARMLADLSRTGDLDLLEEETGRDFELNEAIGGAWHGQTWTWRGILHFWRGDWIAAGPAFEEGLRLDPDGAVSGWGWGWVFQHRAYTGDRKGALSMLAARRDELPRPGGPAWWGPWMMLQSVVEGLVVLGEREDAAGHHTVIAEAIDAGALSGNYHDLRLMERVAGIAAAAGRNWEMAEAHFEAALRLGDELPHRIEAVESRRFYAQMLLERDGPGDRDRAAALATEAAAGYMRLGMPRHVDLAEALLREGTPAER
jgi:tetratricopeptide (TPR) repeat protein